MKTVRILPVDHNDNDFKDMSFDEIQKEFFDKELKNNKGIYWYKSDGLISEEGELVLFQLDNKILASAKYQDSIPFKREYNGTMFNGELWFDQDSIKIFKPITSEELSEIIGEQIRFSNVKYVFKLSDEQYEKLIKRMEEQI